MDKSRSQYTAKNIIVYNNEFNEDGTIIYEYSIDNNKEFIYE